MFKFLFLLSLSFHAFADIHQLELACIPGHVFTIDVADREEGIVFLTASKRIEAGMQMINKIQLEHEKDSGMSSICPWYAQYNLDDTIYCTSENDYAIGVRCSNHCRGSGEFNEITELSLYQLNPEGLKKIFTGLVGKEKHQWYLGDETQWHHNDKSEGCVRFSSEITKNHYNLVLTTKKDILEYESYYEDGSVNSRKELIMIKLAQTKLETFSWDGSKYIRASNTITNHGGFISF